GPPARVRRVPSTGPDHRRHCRLAPPRHRPVDRRATRSAEGSLMSLTRFSPADPRPLTPEESFALATPLPTTAQERAAAVVTPAPALPDPVPAPPEGPDAYSLLVRCRAAADALPDGDREAADRRRFLGRSI